MAEAQCSVYNPIRQRCDTGPAHHLSGMRGLGNSHVTVGTWPGPSFHASELTSAPWLKAEATAEFGGHGRDGWLMSASHFALCWREPIAMSCCLHGGSTCTLSQVGATAVGAFKPQVLPSIPFCSFAGWSLPSLDLMPKFTAWLYGNCAVYLLEGQLYSTVSIGICAPSSSSIPITQLRASAEWCCESLQVHAPTLHPCRKCAACRLSVCVHRGENVHDRVTSWYSSGMPQRWAAGLLWGKMYGNNTVPVFWYGKSSAVYLPETAWGQAWERKTRCLKWGATSRVWFKALTAGLCAVETAGSTSSLTNHSSQTSVICQVFGQGKGHKISVSERRRNEFLRRTEHLWFLALYKSSLYLWELAWGFNLSERVTKAYAVTQMKLQPGGPWLKQPAPSDSCLACLASQEGQPI